MSASSSQTGLRVIRAMLVVVFFGLFTKLGGFLVTGVLIGRFYGSGDVSDAFFAAYQSVIFLLFSIAVKGIMPALMPLFIEEMERKGEAQAWQFASGVINLVIVAALVVAGASVVFAPEIMRRLVPGFFNREAGALSVSMVRIMAPGLVALCLSVVTYALLNSYKVFSVPSAAEAVQKFVWAAVLCAAIVFLSRGATAIAFGFLAGAGAQIVVNLLGLRGRLHFYRPAFGGLGLRRLVVEALILAGFAAGAGTLCWLVSDKNGGEGYQLGILMGAVVLYLLLLWWRAKDSKGMMGRFVALMVPLLLGIIIAKYRDLATNYFTSFTHAGIFSDKQYAERVGNLPTVLWAYALAIAMFPYLCEMASRKDLSSFAGIITRALRMIALFFVPFSLIMVVLGQPLVQLVYDTGRWPAEHVRFCGLALSAFSAAMFFYAIENVVMQSFFSIQRMWMPTVVGVVASCAQIAFLYMGIVTLGYNRPEQIFWFVIVAFPMSRALKNVLLLFILRYHVPILPAKETVRFCVRLAGVAGATVAVTYFSYLPIAKVLGVSKLKVEDVVVDTFNPGETNAIGEEIETRFLKETGFLKTGFPAPACWREARGAALRVENVSSADREPEFALRVDKPGACLERDISRFDLGKVNILSFKVKADREAALRVMLIGKNGRHDQELGVAPSTKRLEYEVKLDKTRLSEIGPIQTLVFADVSAVDATGALWLDTVVFQGDFSLGRRVLFEALKLAQAAIPMALGIVALLATAMALRIEEVGMVFAWLREEGLARIKEKLKGGKRPSAPSGTKAGPVPDVDG